MQINSINTNFSGNLYLNNPELWTKGMKEAIKNNEYIARKLQNHDIFGNIATKIEKKTPPYFANHEVGDTLYKLSFTVTPESQSFFDKVKGRLHSLVKTYDINRHFHSEKTTVERLERFKF